MCYISTVLHYLYYSYYIVFEFRVCTAFEQWLHKVRIVGLGCNHERSIPVLQQTGWITMHRTKHACCNISTPDPMWCNKALSGFCCKHPGCPKCMSITVTLVSCALMFAFRSSKNRTTLVFFPSSTANMSDVLKNCRKQCVRDKAARPQAMCSRDGKDTHRWFVRDMRGTWIAVTESN